MKEFRVTEKAECPGGHKGECFYCHQKIGDCHLPTCVLINKKVRLRMIVEYEVCLPASWDKDQIELHRNNGSWCADNALDEIKEFTEASCLCDIARFEHIEDISEPFLSEDDMEDEEHQKQGKVV